MAGGRAGFGESQQQLCLHALPSTSSLLGPHLAALLPTWLAGCLAAWLSGAGTCGTAGIWWGLGDGVRCGTRHCWPMPWLRCWLVRWSLQHSSWVSLAFLPGLLIPFELDSDSVSAAFVWPVVAAGPCSEDA